MLALAALGPGTPVPPEPLSQALPLRSVSGAVPLRSGSPSPALPARSVPGGVPLRSAATAAPSGSPSAAPGEPVAPVPPGLRFRWPLDGTPRPARRFEPPPQPWLPGHRGVDLVAAPDARVRSAGAGVVLFAGQVAGRPVVTVGHSAGLRTTYEPVRADVRSGDRVAAGTPLGRLLPGHAGCPEAACLHWGLRRGEQYLDPLALLGLGPVRLLPV
ncbi:murein hydrolase activator EnvC family protein [Micromonospora sp. NPDC048830]|uniref:murein hydrolase activator EnvC family protein n=1 Tax=Micromonospora sp. NPDC048830 TaxID=3364257 RepID=UPI00372226EC